MARAGTISRPPSGLPVISSHTHKAKTAAVNAMRRASSITESLRRDGGSREAAGNNPFPLASRHLPHQPAGFPLQTGYRTARRSRLPATTPQQEISPAITA